MIRYFKSPKLRFFLLSAVLSNFLLVFRDLLVAYIWGTSQPIDEFQKDMVIPVMIMTVFSFVLSGALLPVYLQMKRDQPGSLAAFCNRVLANSYSIFIFGFAAGLLLIFGPHSVALSLYALWFSLASIPRTVLLAENRDRPVLIAPIISLIVGLSLLAGLFPWLGIHALSVAYVAFSLLEYLILVLIVKRNFFALKAVAVGFYSKEFEQLQGEMGYLTLSSIFMAVTITIEQRIAMSFGAGALPHYNYAAKICSIMVAVGTAAVRYYVYPSIARDLAGQQVTSAIAKTRSFILIFLGLLSPVCLLLIFWSQPLTATLFQRGAFNAQDTEIVAQVQSYLLLQIPTYFATFVAMQVLLSLQRSKWVAVTLGLHAFSRSAGAILLSHYMGLAGIALGVALAQIVTMAVACYLAFTGLKRRLEKP